MRRHLRAFWVVLALMAIVLAFLLAWSLRDLIREVVVVPIAYVFWLIGRAFEGLPQALIWGALVMGTFLTALRLLAGSVALLPPTHESLESGGRVSDWMRWIELTRKGRYSKDGLARHIGDAAFAVLAYEQRRSQSEVRLLVRDDELLLPSPLDAYLRAAVGRGSLRQETRAASLLPFRLVRPQPEVVSEVEVILDALESALGLTASLPAEGKPEPEGV